MTDKKVIDDVISTLLSSKNKVDPYIAKIDTAVSQAKNLEQGITPVLTTLGEFNDLVSEIEVFINKLPKEFDTAKLKSTLDMFNKGVDKTAKNIEVVFDQFGILVRMLDKIKLLVGQYKE